MSCSEIAGNDHIVVCFFVPSFVGAILLRRFFSSLVHKIDDTNLLRIPITMVKTREKATNSILQCIQPKPRFLVVVANEEHNIATFLGISITDYGSSLVSRCRAMSCMVLHESTCDFRLTEVRAELLLFVFDLNRHLFLNPPFQRSLH